MAIGSISQFWKKIKILKANSITKHNHGDSWVWTEASIYSQVECAQLWLYIVTI